MRTWGYMLAGVAASLCYARAQQEVDRQRPSGGTLEITLGQAIPRTWNDVEKDGYAYAPKQAYDARTGETQVWLPYGSKGCYYETAGLRMTDPGPEGTGTPLAVVHNGSTSGRLVLKLRFDKPIGTFRLYVGWSEWGVGGTTVGGVEYSTDGHAWHNLRQLNSPGIVEPLCDPGKTRIEGLHTRELYIRCYSRDRAHPASDSGPGRWMKLRVAGDPGWGDRAETFFRSQMQVWVTPSDRVGDEERTEEALPPAYTAEAPLDCVGPWGIASGAEWSGDYPEFNPLLRDAGVHWLRYFPEWQTIQPRRGEWNWKQADSMVADARRNGIRMTGVFAYFATWASADGGTRRCPVKDMQYWRDYVTATMARYRNDIRHWEVWNEFNGSFAVDGTPEIYADMTREAYVAAKKIDPAISIGIGCANFDVGWLDAVIKAGGQRVSPLITLYRSLQGDVGSHPRTRLLHQQPSSPTPQLLSPSVNRSPKTALPATPIPRQYAHSPTSANSAPPQPRPHQHHLPPVTPRAGGVCRSR